MRMAAEYFVDHYRLWSNGDLQHRRYDCDSLESAQDRMDSCIWQSDTTLVRLCRRGIGRRSSTLRVWNGM